jgi:hypothetical protein
MWSRRREGVYSPGYDYAGDQQRLQRLHHHQDFRSATQERRVGRAECGTRIEGEEEVV